MALMNDIIGRYQKEASQRITDARHKSPSEVQDKQELIDSIVIHQGTGKYIPAQVQRKGGSIFDAPPTTVIKEHVKRYNSGQIDVGQQNFSQQRPTDTNTVVFTPQQDTSSSGDVFKELDKLRAENRKLRNELEEVRKTMNKVF